jgi:hypothetical protein
VRRTALLAAVVGLTFVSAADAARPYLGVRGNIGRFQRLALDRDLPQGGSGATGVSTTRASSSGWRKFVRTHRRVELLSWFDSTPGSIWDLGSKPKSRAAYRRFIVPLGRKPSG